MRLWGALAALALAGFCLAGCGPKPQFHIVAGSEQKSLEPLVQGVCAKQHVTCDIDYKGSLDIGQLVGSDQSPTIDAVWPASSLWIELYDKNHRVKEIGVKIELTVLESATFSAALSVGPRDAKYDLAVLSWTVPTADPDEPMMYMTHTKAWKPAGANRMFFSNPETDRLAEAAHVESDLARASRDGNPHHLDHQWRPHPQLAGPGDGPAL